MQGLLGRGLWRPGEAWAQGGGHRGEAGCQDTHPLADHLDDARGKVAHAVGAPLTLVDVALPAAVRMLLKHLWQTGRGMVTSCARRPAPQLRSSSSCPPSELPMMLKWAYSPAPASIQPNPWVASRAKKESGVSPRSDPSSTAG